MDMLWMLIVYYIHSVTLKILRLYLILIMDMHGTDYSVNTPPVPFTKTVHRTLFKRSVLRQRKDCGYVVDVDCLPIGRDIALRSDKVK